MKDPDKMNRTAVLTECALMAALAFGLSLAKFSLPYGGSVTLCSTLPLAAASLRHGWRWGVLTCFVFSCLQAILGAGTIAMVGGTGLTYVLYVILCALLDYILAYTVLGFTGLIARAFRNRVAGLVAGVTVTGVLRFLCSFTSGVLLWGSYAPEGQTAAFYSLTYNLTWWLPDLVVLLIVIIPLSFVRAVGLVPQRRDDARPVEKPCPGV